MLPRELVSKMVLETGYLGCLDAVAPYDQEVEVPLQDVSEAPKELVSVGIGRWYAWESILLMLLTTKLGSGRLCLSLLSTMATLFSPLRQTYRYLVR